MKIKKILLERKDFDEIIQMPDAEMNTIWEFLEYDYDDNKIMVPGPIVWFTPEIPIPFGPIGIDGLPGVVLEASEKGKMYFYATKIISDYKDPLITIEIPKGKFITPEEYDRKITEKY